MRPYFIFLTILLLSFTANHENLMALTLPGDNTISAAAGDQISPSLSRGTNSILAVWSDGRSNPYGLYEYESGRDIYGIRMDVNGNLIDTLPTSIVSRQSNQENPKASWNGTNWLVVYESYDVGGTGYYYQKSLEAVRVSSAGQILDAQPIKLFGMTPSGGAWAVASDGNNWVIVNQATSVNSDIVVVRISPAGVVMDPPTNAVVKATYYTRTNFKLAFAGGVFLFTFDDQYVNGTNTTSAIRFDSNLNLLDSNLIALLNTPLSDLSSNGTQFFAVWNQQLPDFSMAVTGSRISTTGQKLDGAGKNISATFPNDAYATIAGTWDGINWKITWANNNAVRVSRFSPTGSVLDPGGVAVPGPLSGITTGTGSGGVQITWIVYRNNNYDIQSANISSANVAGPNHDLSIGSPQQLRADVAASGSGYMVVYRSSSSGVNRVLAQPLDASGNPLTAQPVQLDSGNNSTGPGTPNVAWNGSLYLVAWGNASGVVAQRLQPNGTKIDAAPFVVMNPAFGPADVAALGSDFLVAARKFGFTTQIINVIAARVRGTSGAVLDPVPLAITSGYAQAPASTVLGGQWLVAFHDHATHDSPYTTTQGAFVSTMGAVSGFLIHPTFSTSGGNGIFELGLASSGNVALMVQSQELTSGVETDLLAHTISSGGTVGPMINLTPWSGNQYRPRVSWDGSNFVVIFQDQKNRLAVQTLDQLDARSDLVAMRVNTQGTKIDPQGFVFSVRPTSETDPAVASANGVSLLAGSLMTNDSAFAGYRIAFSFFGSPVNKFPVAVINPDTTGGDVSLPVNFNSIGSADPDGNVASYLWNFGDGFTSSQPNPAHTFSTPGARLTTLTVTDNQGAQTQQAVMINVTSPNQPPVAVASANITSGKAPLDVIFYADGSYDPDGFTGNLEWTFSDGGTYYGSPAYHTFYSTGVFTATLRVYDSRGASGTSSVTINITGANQPPVAHASATPTSGSVPLVVAFSSAGSADPDGGITAYQWDFGDAIGFSSAANPTYTYNYAGTFNAKLTVWDSNNASSSATLLITVSPNSTSLLRSTAITLSGAKQGKKVSISAQVTVRNGSNIAVSGATVYGTWTKPNGSKVTQSANTNASGLASFNTSGASGNYIFTITNIAKSGYTFDSANSVLSSSITK